MRSPSRAYWAWLPLMTRRSSPRDAYVRAFCHRSAPRPIRASPATMPSAASGRHGLQHPEDDAQRKTTMSSPATKRLAPGPHSLTDSLHAADDLVPGTMGSRRGIVSPSTCCRSVRPTAQAATSSTSSPRPTTGTALSTSRGSGVATGAGAASTIGLISPMPSGRPADQDDGRARSVAALPAHFEHRCCLAAGASSKLASARWR